MKTTRVVNIIFLLKNI